MKHLTKKLSLAGGKSKPKPQPARLKPPKLGKYEIASSFSYAEVLDLISDGPIEGLVNQDGIVLDNRNILQGVYLDDTPVMVTDSAAIDIDTNSENIIDLSVVSDAIVDLCSQINSLSALTTVDAPNGYKAIGAWRDTGTSSFRIPRIQSLDLDADWNDLPAEDNLIENAPENYWITDNKAGVDISINYYKMPSNKMADRLDIESLIDNLNSQNANTKTYIERNLTQNLGEGWEHANLKQNFIEWFEAKAKDKVVLLIDGIGTPTTNADDNLYEGDNVLRPLNLDFTMSPNLLNSATYNFLSPVVLDNGDIDATANMIGFIVIVLESTINEEEKYELGGGGRAGRTYVYNTYGTASIAISWLASIAGSLSDLQLANKQPVKSSASKFNYTNILAEIATGSEFQKPLKYFNKIFIDHQYGFDLLGPFVVAGDGVQRIQDDGVTAADFLQNDTITPSPGIPANESSLDIRARGATAEQDFSSWDNDIITFDESAIPVKHVVENPNVESVFLSFQINTLADTLWQQIGSTDPGTRYPAILNIEVEVGTIEPNGLEITAYTNKYQILALIESPTILDIGNPDSTGDNDKITTKLSAESLSGPGDITTPFTLPPAAQNENPSTIPEVDPDATNFKRYIKVTKLSTETNSVLLTKDVSLLKVTEIIPVNVSYPFSAIMGTKIDSRVFSSIPTRTFDAKLKKIKIPSNYFPSRSNGKDKRYYDTTAEHTAAAPYDKLVYQGDWDGTFKIGWTDNPAWVLYDLLTNKRYGLGQYITEDQVNKWELYKIARFCDSVDDNGYFTGTPDGRGGLEPRFSCNILFQEDKKIFDAINIVSTLFRGVVYFLNGEIHFADDRVRSPVALFTNSNVVDGIFSYSNHRRDEQFNSVEVVYIDRFDNFKTKVEYVEDEEDIRQRGLFKKTVNALGITSKAMAQRAAHHLIYQTVKENQSVTFTAGLESQLCPPGSLFIVEDQLKSLQSNFGRVLAIDEANLAIRLNENYDDTVASGSITVYIPTGNTIGSELDELAATGRRRLNGFDVTDSYYPQIEGNYAFSGYIDGYTGDPRELIPYYNQYPVYTGGLDNHAVVWFSTEHTGWVWSSGSYGLDTEFTGVTPGANYAISDVGYNQIIDSYNSSNLTHYQVSEGNKRHPTDGSMYVTINNNSGQLSDYSRGVTNSEIDLNDLAQIYDFNVTGVSGNDFGCSVFIDPTDVTGLINFIPVGSAYRYKRANSVDQIYKVISVKENSPNQYVIIGTKYDTGKYEFIENQISIDEQSATFGYTGQYSVDGVNYTVLAAPSIATFETGEGFDANSFSLTGEWDAVSNATGYLARLILPNGQISETTTSTTGVFWDNDGLVGNFTLAVAALGNPFSSSTQKYLNSNYSTSGISSLGEGVLATSLAGPAITSIEF